MYKDTHISRRQWLYQTGGAIGAGALALSSIPSARAATLANAWQSSYKPWDAPASSISSKSLSIKGKVPAALQGTLYRNGPARFGRGKSHLTHWFDGDGMIQAFRIADGSISHQGEILVTPKSIKEQQAGRFLYGGFGSNPVNPAAVYQPDDVNAANINILAMSKGEDIYALWEGGSALKVDPHTLASGNFKVWSDDTKGAPFAAHPRIAADGTLWSFGYMSGTGKLIIYQIDRYGKLQRSKLLEAPQAEMVHDFAITQNHLVFLLHPIRFDKYKKRVNQLEAMSWDATAPLLAMVVSMADFSSQIIELDNSGVFHLGNAWEDGMQIYFDYVHHHNIVANMRSFDINNTAPDFYNFDTSLKQVKLNLRKNTGVVVDTGIKRVEFPRFDQRRTGEESNLITMVQYNQDIQIFQTLVLVDGDKVSSYDFGKGWWLDEHIYVPHPTKSTESAGWIIGTAYNWRDETTTLNIFAARDIEAGPMAQASLTYGLPIGLHGQFVAS